MAPVPTQTILDQSASSTLPSTGSISLMPFTLGHDGPARISTFFHPRPFETAAAASTSKLEDEGSISAHRQASFRGRRIVSSTLVLPDDYRGLVYSMTAPLPPSQDAAAEEEKGTAAEREERAAKRAKRAAASAAALDTLDVTEANSIGVDMADESTSLRRSPRKSTTAASSRARERAVRAAKDKARRKAAQDAAKKGGFSLDSDEDDDAVEPTANETDVTVPSLVPNESTEVTQPEEAPATDAAGLDASAPENTAEQALDEAMTTAAAMKAHEPTEEEPVSVPPPPPLRTLSTVSTASSGVITSTPRAATPAPLSDSKEPSADIPIPDKIAQDDEPVTLARDEKRLVPCLTFDRIEVWNPDWPLAGGKVAEDDEVGRAITEWIGLAAKIHAY